MKIAALLESRNIKFRIWSGWAILSLLVLLLMSIYIWTLYQQVQKSARVEAEAASKMVALSFDGRIQHLDDVLLHTRDSFDRYGPGLTEKDALFKTKRDLDELPYKTIVIINATGDVILSLPPMPKFRDFTRIAELASDRDDEMPFSSVVLDDNISYFVRIVPLHFNDGTFAGAVFGEFDRNWLNEKLVDTSDAYGLIINLYYGDFNLASSLNSIDAIASKKINRHDEYLYKIIIPNAEVSFETYIDQSVFNKRWEGALGYLSLGIIVALLGLTVGAILLQQTVTKNLASVVVAQVANNSTLLKSRFLANMSHELRTPMSGVLGAVELLFETKLTTAQNDYLVLIERSGKHLLSILNDILDISKIEANSLTLEIQSVSPVSLIEDIVQMMKPQAYLKGLSVYAQLDIFSSVTVGLDSFRLTQVITNLLGNAIKFTSEGYVCVTATIADSSIGTSLILRIRDTGIGISKEATRNLFQPFFQADLSTSRQFGGSGLGLVISKELLQLMGGEIEVFSELGVGSVFSLKIPVSFYKSIEEEIPVVYPSVNLFFENDNLKKSVLIHLKNLGILYVDANSYKNLQSNGNVILTDVLSEETFQLFKGRCIQILDSTASRFPKDLINSALDKVIKLVEPFHRKELSVALLGFSMDNKSTAEAYIETEVIVPNCLQGVSVLVAEDTLINQKILKSFLDSLRCQSVFVSDGQGAINAISHQNFDVVIMDCHMPNVDGYDATKEIRRIELARQDGSHTPIIALTASITESDKLKCKEVGMDDFCGKPISKKILQEKLEYWINI